jgi:hypothetical protein
MSAGVRASPRIAAAVMMLAGCGGGSPAGPGGATGGGNGAAYGVPAVPDGIEPIDSFAADELAAECATSVRCHRSATADGCVAASLPPVAPRVAQDVQSGVIAYDPHLAYRCIQLLLIAPCNGGADLESCHDAFTGTLPSGASCGLNAECASGSCAMPGCASGCCPPGTCTAGVEARNVPVGGACAFGGCAEGEYCATTDGVCRGRVGKGGSCAHAICQWGLVCSNTSQTCVAPAPVGGSCLGNFCDGDGTCMSAAGVCASAPVAGDACAKAGTCGLSLNCVGGVCVTPGAVGQACVGDVGSTQCQRGVTPTGMNQAGTCAQGVCVAPDPTAAGIDCLSP